MNFLPSWGTIMGEEVALIDNDIGSHGRAKRGWNIVMKRV
jgi:hypothetical protein